MKRRLGIAQALLNDPKILIFDELTAVLQEKDIENIFIPLYTISIVFLFM